MSIRRVIPYSGFGALLIVIGIVTFVMVLGVNAQIEPRSNCAERESYYNEGRLIYQCEVVELSPGVFVVRESGSQVGQFPVDRPATAVEILSYQGVTAERQCIADQRAANAALATPARDSTLSVVAERVRLIEDAIRSCIQ